ncbi:MAG: GDSL-type esterase/lipase family protein [Janthinobacterium lividum]
MALNRTQLKAFFRTVIKVVPGASPSAKTRGQGLLNAFDNFADAAQLAEDATPLAPGTTITAATVSDSTAAGRALLTAADAKAQRGLLDRLGFAADAYGKGQPALPTVYGADAGSGAIAYLLTQLAQLQGAAFAQAPTAPTLGQVDDTGDTFSFLPNPLFPAFSQYKAAGLPGVTGAVALDATNSYVTGSRVYVKVVGAVPAKGLSVYVAGSGNVPDGAPLLSTEAFTGPAVSTAPTTPAATTPDAPFPSFDATTRTLTYAHALGTSELEINHLGGAYQPYAAVSVDDASHTAGEWKARVKAYVAGNRGVSGSADSPAIAAKAVAVNQIPTANAGSDATVLLPTNTLALMGTVTDPDGPAPQVFAWRYVTGPNVPSGLPASTLNVVVAGLIAGVYQFGFKTQDAAGAWSNEDFVLVTVNAAAPSIAGVSPGTGAVGAQVSISGANFGDTQGNSVVKFNSIVAQIVSWASGLIVALVPSSASTGRVTVTASGATATSAVDFTIQAAAPGFTSYPVPESAWADTGSAEAGVDGNPLRATFSSVTFTTAATQVNLELSSSLAQLGAATTGVGVWVNGVFQRVAFAADGAHHYGAIANVPAGTNTFRVEMPDQARVTVDGSDLAGTSFYAVQADAGVSFVNETVPDVVCLWVGDSFLGGGGATEPFTDALTELNRKRVKASARVRVQSVSGGCLLETYGPTSNRSSFLARTKGQLNGGTQNVLILEDGTNAAGRGNRTPDAYGAAYNQFLTDLQAAGIANLSIVCITPTPVPAAVGYEAKAEQVRAQIRTAAASHNARLIEGGDLIQVSDLKPNDLHPSTAGHKKYEANYWAKYTGNATADATFLNSEFDLAAVADPQKGWATGSGCAIASGVLTFANASFDGTGLGNTRQSVVMTLGNLYRLEVKANSVSSGQIEVRTATGQNGQITAALGGAITAAGVYYKDFTCNSATEVFSVQGLNGANAALEYVRLAPIAAGTPPPSTTPAGTASSTFKNSEFDAAATTDENQGWKIANAATTSISGGQLVFAAAAANAANDVTQNVALVAGTQYRIELSSTGANVSLLAYNGLVGASGQFEPGTGVRAQTFTAGTTGTERYTIRCAGSGSVAYVRLTAVTAGTPPTASNLLLNGEFDSAATGNTATGWACGSQCSVANGVLHFASATGAGSGDTRQQVAMTVGTAYKLEMSIKALSGGVVSLLTDSGQNGQFDASKGDATGSVGILTKTFTCQVASEVYYVRGQNGVTADVDYIRLTPA